MDDGRITKYDFVLVVFMNTKAYLGSIKELLQQTSLSVFTLQGRTTGHMEMGNESTIDGLSLTGHFSNPRSIQSQTKQSTELLMTSIYYTEDTTDIVNAPSELKQLVARQSVSSRTAICFADCFVI